MVLKLDMSGRLQISFRDGDVAIVPKDPVVTELLTSCTQIVDVRGDVLSASNENYDGSFTPSHNLDLLGSRLTKLKMVRIFNFQHSFGRVPFNAPTWVVSMKAYPRMDDAAFGLVGSLDPIPTSASRLVLNITTSERYGKPPSTSNLNARCLLLEHYDMDNVVIFNKEDVVPASELPEWFDGDTEEDMVDIVRFAVQDDIVEAMFWNSEKFWIVDCGYLTHSHLQDSDGGEHERMETVTRNRIAAYPPPYSGEYEYCRLNQFRDIVGEGQFALETMADAPDLHVLPPLVPVSEAIQDRLAEVHEVVAANIAAAGPQSPEP